VDKMTAARIGMTIDNGDAGHERMVAGTAGCEDT
jgi:hypothetical protein